MISVHSCSFAVFNGRMGQSGSGTTLRCRGSNRLRQPRSKGSYAGANPAGSILWMAGEYKLVAPVPKTGSPRKGEVGALPTPSATFMFL